MPSPSASPSSPLSGPLLLLSQWVNVCNLRGTKRSGYLGRLLNKRKRRDKQPGITRDVPGGRELSGAGRAGPGRPGSARTCVLPGPATGEALHHHFSREERPSPRPACRSGLCPPELCEPSKSCTSLVLSVLICPVGRMTSTLQGLRWFERREQSHRLGQCGRVASACPLVLLSGAQGLPGRFPALSGGL